METKNDAGVSVLSFGDKNLRVRPLCCGFIDKLDRLDCCLYYVLIFGKFHVAIYLAYRCGDCFCFFNINLSIYSANGESCKVGPAVVQ